VVLVQQAQPHTHLDVGRLQQQPVRTLQHRTAAAAAAPMISMQRRRTYCVSKQLQEIFAVQRC
jgi:hypothetical protein